MRTAILGWGSLLWERQPAFDAWRGDWYYDGPILKLEFSRISITRLRALTLVIDERNGSPCTVAWFLSKRRELEDAISDLRCREGTMLGKIGHMTLTDGVVDNPIAIWARDKPLDAVVWTKLQSNFEEETGKAFSVPAAVSHVRNLEPEAKIKAAEYMWRAPDFVKTPLRAILQAEPWFKPA